MFYYQLFNLIISSPMACPFLKELDQAKPDVAISLGKCPDFLSKVSGEKSYYDGNSHQLLLVIDRLAKFLVCSGKKITIELFPEADINLLWTYLLGSVIGAVLQQRGLLVLHGNSVVCSDGRGIVFLADSGMGKSTLTAALYEAGYSVLSDDVSAVYFDNKNRAYLLPSLPQIKLHQDVISAYQYSEDQLFPMGGGLNKYRVILKDAGRFKTPVPLSRICELNFGDFNVASISPLDAFSVLRKHTYRFCYLEAMQRQAQHFMQAVQLSGMVTACRVNRPEDLSNQSLMSWLSSECPIDE